MERSQERHQGTCYQQAALLLENVLDEKISARVALNRWSTLAIEGDSSIDAAYQALWHFEADEEQQQTELFYLDAQWSLLHQMSKYLDQGKPLPEHLITSYPQTRTIRFYEEQESLKRVFAAPWLSLKRRWLTWRTLFQKALQAIGWVR